jgi:membrane protein DedA with SNARE-associated domain/rhodanese-related sulfurtransferase
MNDALDLLVHHGPGVLFAAVFVEQLGLPVPAAPVLVAAGALAATNQMNELAALAAAVLAAVLADLLWFQIGRARGDRIMNLLCRVSLEPDSCIHRTENVFSRYGPAAILTAKFIPGLSLVMPPLAAISNVSLRRFLLFDTLGSGLYAGSYLLLGLVFSNQLLQMLQTLSQIGRSALALLLGLLAVYLALKYLKRKIRLRVPRISVEDLHQKQEAGEPLLIVDLRSAAQLNHAPLGIRGALHLQMDQLRSQLGGLPTDRDVVLYCDCPKEASSARAALLLHKHGLPRARPLAGGLDAWRQRNYPVAPLAAGPPALNRFHSEALVAPVINAQLETRAQPLPLVNAR